MRESEDGKHRSRGDEAQTTLVSTRKVVKAQGLILYYKPLGLSLCFYLFLNQMPQTVCTVHKNPGDISWCPNLGAEPGFALGFPHGRKLDGWSLNQNDCRLSVDRRT